MPSIFQSLQRGRQVSVDQRIGSGGFRRSVSRSCGIENGLHINIIIVRIKGFLLLLWCGFVRTGGSRATLVICTPRILLPNHFGDTKYYETIRQN